MLWFDFQLQRKKPSRHLFQGLIQKINPPSLWSISEAIESLDLKHQELFSCLLAAH